MQRRPAWYKSRMSPSVVVALCTCPDRGTAERLAEALVGEQLCACVNLVGPIQSIYRWQGKVERSDEVLCILKTAADRVAELRRRLPALHPYEVPELVVLPIEDGLPSYLDWVVASTRSTTPS